MRVPVQRVRDRADVLRGLVDRGLGRVPGREHLPDRGLMPRRVEPLALRGGEHNPQCGAPLAAELGVDRVGRLLDVRARDGELIDELAVEGGVQAAQGHEDRDLGDDHPQRVVGGVAGQPSRGAAVRDPTSRLDDVRLHGVVGRRSPPRRERSVDACDTRILLHDSKRLCRLRSRARSAPPRQWGRQAHRGTAFHTFLAAALPTGRQAALSGPRSGVDCPYRVRGAHTSRTPNRYDAIIVGCGHNGLVAAFYLARAGLRTLALERRSFVGGCCVTEEFAPGYRASTGAYVLSMLREAIWRDMRLAERGLTVSPAGPSLNLFPDGGAVHALGGPRRDRARDCAFHRPATRAGSGTSSRSWPRWPRIVVPMFDWTPPTARRAPTSCSTAARMGRRALGGRRDLLDLMFLFSTSATQYLDTWFESDHLKAIARLARDQRQRVGPLHPGDGLRAAARPRVRGVGRRCAHLGLRPRRHGRGDRG